MNFLNTRLFPTAEGANAYEITGIAARCDWVVLTDWTEEYACLRKRVEGQPRSVFLSLRANFRALRYFHDEVLPAINNKFVLVSGSEDFTIPNQTDARWRKSTEADLQLIDSILEDTRLIHWFAENRDASRPKMSTLPTGYVYKNQSPQELEPSEPDLAIIDRPLRVLCGHRVREGDQWQVRREVTALCESQFSSFSTVLTDTLPLDEFQREIRAHPFVICAQGGGLDPSPKAWMSIANGSVPIVKSSVLDDAYSKLPVAFVDTWDERCLSLRQLQRWLEELAPFYLDHQLRRQTLERLEIDYWWQQIENYFANRGG